MNKQVFFAARIKEMDILEYITAAVLVAVCYLIAILTSEMAYLTVDDGYYQATMNGDLLGRPFPVALCINPVLSYPVTFLYRICPSIQWWYVYSHVIVIVGLFLINLCIIKTSKKEGMGSWVAFAIICIMDVGFLIYNTANVSFTIAPAIFGTGIVGMMLYIGKYSNKKYPGIVAVLAVLSFVLMYIHREQTGVAVLCYILLAYLYVLVDYEANIKKVIPKMLILCIAVFVIGIFLYFLNDNVKKKKLGADFYENGGLPISYIDFTNDSYEENRAVYEEAGWTEDVYILVHKYCFMLDEVNTENLNYIIQNIDYKKLTKKEIDDTFLSQKSSRSILLIWAFSVIIIGIALCVNFDFKSMMFSIVNNLGTLLLITYQIITGRVRYRSVVILILPAFLINCFLFLGRAEAFKKRHVRKKIFFVIMALFCVFYSAGYTFDSKTKEKTSTNKKNEKAVYEYVEENNENIYIIPVYTVRSHSPWNYDGKNHPANLIRWGDNGYNSNLYKAQLRLNGIKKLDGGVFKNNKRFFIINSDVHAGVKMKHNAVFAVFYRYLKENYNVVGFRQIDSINENIFVYKFIYGENAHRYKSYLDIDNNKVIRIKNSS